MHHQFQKLLPPVDRIGYYFYHQHLIIKDKEQIQSIKTLSTSMHHQFQKLLPPVDRIGPEGEDEYHH